MRVCCVKGCENRSRSSKTSSRSLKVHVLPQDEETASKWLEAIPELAEVKTKTPAVCHLHFKASDYGGKSMRFLKSFAVPDLNNVAAAVAAQNDEFVRRPKKPKLTCTITEHAKMLKRIASLEKDNAALTIDCKQQRAALARQSRTSDKCKHSVTLDMLKTVRNGSGSGIIFGPAQIKGLLTGSTRGSVWTPEEREKATKLKSMTSKNCYEYIRTQLIPLPSDRDIPGTFDEKPPQPLPTAKLAADSNNVHVVQVSQEQQAAAVTVLTSTDQSIDFILV
jgi:hypothetical protein